MHIYTYTYRIHIDAIIKTSEDTSFRKIYLSLYLKCLCVRGSWRPNRTATYWPQLSWPSALCLSHSSGLLNWRPGGPLRWVLFFLLYLVSNASDLQLTDFLSSTSYIIVQSPTQYLWNGMFGRVEGQYTTVVAVVVYFHLIKFLYKEYLITLTRDQGTARLIGIPAIFSVSWQIIVVLVLDCFESVLWSLI